MAGNKKPPLDHSEPGNTHSLFRSLIENIQDMIGIIDSDGIIRYASPSLKKYLGYDPAEVIEENIFHFIHPDERKRAIEQFNIIRESPPQTRFPTIEIRIRHKDGSWRYLESTTQPLDLPDIQGFVINARDITSRKENERVLHETLELLQDIMDGSPSIIFVKDRKGRFLAINSRLEELLGKNRDQILGKTDFDIFSREWAEYYQTHDRRVLELDRPVQLEEELEAADGTTHMFLSNKFPLHDTDGRSYAVCGISTDITGRKQQEEELKKANRTLKAISDIDQVMMRSTDEMQLLEDACRIIVEDCGYPMVWIGYAAEDEKKTITPMASAGFEEGYLQALNFTWADNEWGRGPTGTAIRTGNYYICRNMLTDPGFAPFREEALKRGYASSVALPLAGEEGRTFGALTLYSRHPDPFSTDEIKLLRELVGDLEYGIATIRLRITKEKAEEKIRMNEARLELALKSGHAGTFDWNAEQDINLWSDELLDMYGLKREQFGMRYEDWLACLVPEDRHVMETAVEESLQTGEFDQEFRIRRHDTGEIRWMHGRGRIFLDEAGRPVRMIGINFDITEQKQSEKDLRESEERYRITLQSITDGICIQAVRDARYLYCNTAFVNMSGYPEDEIIGKTPFELGLPVDFDDQDNYMRCVTCSTDSNRMAIRHRRKDGTILDTLVSCKTIQYRGEDCSVVVIADITEFKRSEDEKKRLESQLAQTQKMEALGTLAGGVAHDFNNILTAIMGYAELARMNAAHPEKVDKNLENALKSCKRARDLVGQILSFSRHAGAGFTRLTLSYTIEESLNMLRSLIPSNIEIRRNLDANSKVNADPSQINQMIINLSVNAAQAMGVNGGVLDISLDRAWLNQTDSLAFNVPEGPYLRIRVKDTGQGIPPEIMNHIFEPYFTTKKAAGSTGLGLSIVHGIVKRHAGAVTVKSVSGRGTTFEIYLPEAPPEEEETVKSAELEIPTGTERILFVDDEEALVEVAENLLSALGYKVSAFTGSLEALDFFRKNAGNVDLMVTDMTMPDLTGDRLAVEVLKTRPELPVIMYTGYSEYITEERAKSLGIRKFILKPFEIEDLARSIRRELDRK